MASWDATFSTGATAPSRLVHSWASYVATQRKCGPAARGGDAGDASAGGEGAGNGAYATKGKFQKRTRMEEHVIQECQGWTKGQEVY